MAKIEWVNRRTGRCRSDFHQDPEEHNGARRFAIVTRASNRCAGN